MHLSMHLRLRLRLNLSTRTKRMAVYRGRIKRRRCRISHSTQGTQMQAVRQIQTSKFQPVVHIADVYIMLNCFSRRVHIYTTR